MGFLFCGFEGILFVFAVAGIWEIPITFNT